MNGPIQHANGTGAATARQLLRQWLAGSEDDAVAAVEALGREAIRVAGQGAERLERGAAMGASAQDVLRELQALADAFVPPPPPPRRLPFPWRARPAAPAPTSADLNVLVAGLERERDNVEHAAIAIATDMARLQAAEDGLENALALVRGCGAAIESAARELAVDRPDRARFLTGKLAPRLLERERDLLTQLAVTRQGRLALQLVADGQDALGQAIERARETSVAALRTALAARQAIAGNRDLLRQAEALEQTAQAARGAPAAGRDADRALADALEQVRRAIDAAQVPARSL